LGGFEGKHVRVSAEGHQNPRTVLIESAEMREEKANERFARQPSIPMTKAKKELSRANGPPSRDISVLWKTPG